MIVTAKQKYIWVFLSDPNDENLYSRKAVDSFFGAWEAGLLAGDDSCVIEFNNDYS